MLDIFFHPLDHNVIDLIAYRKGLYIISGISSILYNARTNEMRNFYTAGVCFKVVTHEIESVVAARVVATLNRFISFKSNRDVFFRLVAFAGEQIVRNRMHGESGCGNLQLKSTGLPQMPHTVCVA